MGNIEIPQRFLLEHWNNFGFNEDINVNSLYLKIINFSIYILNRF